MFSNVVTEKLGIQYPIIQGGMAWVANASLAVAVSEAGGLGIISAMNADKEFVREEIRKFRRASNRPFGVNIMLMSPYKDDIAELVIAEKVPVVTTGAGNPAPYIPKWKEAGITVLPVVASKALARMVERSGADMVIAEGTEAGGHIGELTTFCLVPQIAEALKIPVIAAGGIATGRQMAASFLLGASGVQMGTAFLTVKECTIHQNYKNMILKASDISTIVTGKKLSHPVRSLKNSFSRDYARIEYSDISDEELEQLAAGRLRLAVMEGDVEKGCFLAGQCAGLVHEELSAKEFIDKIMSEAKEAFQGVVL